MSVDIRTYIGPFIKVYNTPKPATDEYYCCPNKECKKYGITFSSKHCEECGSKIKLLKFPSHKKTSMWEILEDFNDTLSQAMGEYRPDGMDDYEFLIPNVKNILSRDAHFDPKHDTYAVNIYAELIMEETAILQKKYAKEIKILKEKFGDDNVVVLWGVLGWLS